MITFIGPFQSNHWNRLTWPSDLMVDLSSFSILTAEFALLLWKIWLKPTCMEAQIGEVEIFLKQCAVPRGYQVLLFWSGIPKDYLLSPTTEA